MRKNWNLKCIGHLEAMAAKMNEHETFSCAIISFDEISFVNSNTENSANNFTFSEDVARRGGKYLATICKEINIT